LSTSKGSRREFTFHKGKANISDGDLVSKVAVEVRSFVGNVSRPLLLNFRDTFADLLGKADLRHESSPVVSFFYDAFTRWALWQSERATIGVWLFVGVY
jgi:hypothetical protein